MESYHSHLQPSRRRTHAPIRRHASYHTFRRHSAAGGLTPLRPAVASILAGTAEESDDEAGEEAVEHL